MSEQVPVGKEQRCNRCFTVLTNQTREQHRKVCVNRSYADSR